MARPDRKGAAARGAVRPDVVRAVLRHHAKGVAVITAGTDTPVGFCATSLTSLCLEPPLMSFTVGLRSASWATVRSAPQVMVHLLADGQEDLARLFGSGGTAKFGPATRWHRGPFGLPVLDGALARLVLAPTGHLPAGDHALVIARVTAAWHGDGAGRGPLIHHGGEFVRIGGSRRRPG